MRAPKRASKERRAAIVRPWMRRHSVRHLEAAPGAPRAETPQSRWTRATGFISVQREQLAVRRQTDAMIAKAGEDEPGLAESLRVESVELELELELS